MTVMTQCTKTKYSFPPHFHRKVQVDFSAQPISSDGGGLFFREIEAQCQIIQEFASCFTDYRDPDQSEFSVLDLLKQQVFGLALGCPGSTEIGISLRLH